MCSQCTAEAAGPALKAVELPVVRWDVTILGFAAGLHHPLASPASARAGSFGLLSPTALLPPTLFSPSLTCSSLASPGIILDRQHAPLPPHYTHFDFLSHQQQHEGSCSRHEEPPWVSASRHAVGEGGPLKNATAYLAGSPSGYKAGMDNTPCSQDIMQHGHDQRNYILQQQQDDGHGVSPRHSCSMGLSPQVSQKQHHGNPCAGAVQQGSACRSGEVVRRSNLGEVPYGTQDLF